MRKLIEGEVVCAFRHTRYLGVMFQSLDSLLTCLAPEHRGFKHTAVETLGTARPTVLTSLNFLNYLIHVKGLAASCAGDLGTSLQAHGIKRKGNRSGKGFARTNIGGPPLDALKRER